MIHSIKGEKKKEKRDRKLSGNASGITETLRSIVTKRDFFLQLLLWPDLSSSP